MWHLYSSFVHPDAYNQTQSPFWRRHSAVSRVLIVYRCIFESGVIRIGYGDR